MSRQVAALAVLLGSGCRYGFTDQNVGVLDDASSDTTLDVLADVPSDVALHTVTYGERSGSMTTGVMTDTILVENDPTTNYGNDENHSVDGGIPSRERQLIRIDLSSIAPGTTVYGARLNVVIVSYGDQMDGQLALHAIGQAWNENVATWELRDTATLWTEAGGSIGANIVTTFTPGATAATIELPALLFQDWVNDPTGNFGFVLTAGDETLDTHYHFHSSESQQTANRPLLSLDIPI